jgi:hypothetical protein
MLNTAIVPTVKTIRPMPAQRKNSHGHGGNLLIA